MSATIPIEGGERWEILLNGESTQGYDAGGPGPDGFVQAEAELDGTTVMITVSTDGEGHTVSMSEDPFGEEMVDVNVDLADDQPERGSSWVVTEGEHEGAEIDLLPAETERVGLPSDVASYTDEIFADIAEHLHERGVTETDKVTKLELRVVAGEAVEVTEVEDGF